MYDCIQNDGFKNVTDSDNLEEASAIFSETFGTILNRHAPLKVTQVRNNYVSWISKETKQLQKKRDLLKKQALEEQNADKFTEYKLLRNQISGKLGEEKINYYKNKFYCKNQSTSQLWNQANTYLNTTNRAFNNSPSLIIQNGKSYTSPRDMANAFNDTFINKVQNLCGKIGNTFECVLLRD